MYRDVIYHDPSPAANGVRVVVGPGGPPVGALLGLARGGGPVPGGVAPRLGLALDPRLQVVPGLARGLASGLRVGPG